MYHINYDHLKLHFLLSSLSLSLSLSPHSILCRRTGALWFESEVLLSTLAESARTNAACRPPADFCNTTQTLVFPVDTTEMRIIVPIEDDDIAEDTETFLVELSDPSNAVIDESQNRIKIYISDTDDCEYALYVVQHDHTHT